MTTNYDIDTDIPDVGPTEEPSPWENVPLREIPDDATDASGASLWAFLGENGLTKEVLEDLQKKHMKNNGKPKNLYMVAMIDHIFIVREITQGDYRAISQKCTEDEAALVAARIAINPEFKVQPQDSTMIEWANTCDIGVVWPEDFNPKDDDLPFPILPGLYTKIMEVTGAYDVPMLKKL